MAVDHDVETLINNLKDPKLAVDAACSLAATKDLMAVDPLIDALNTDKNADVRAMAAYALGEIGSEKALGPLKKAAKEDYDQVKRSADQAIKKIQVKRALTNF
ncbi:HEAT repeat domain-containing protein [Methanocella sp. CWC-04]|uniref:HEAT repeat domain-containing protein n=2 Tax=Methanooceanicella nereidis TaxID=2052831 RepID=A0AAP2RDQ7_9EURY|nr:HEAT repeat domain-containing protein [Methanocella sp. CWC-04]